MSSSTDVGELYYVLAKLEGAITKTGWLLADIVFIGNHIPTILIFDSYIRDL